MTFLKKGAIYTSLRIGRRATRKILPFWEPEKMVFFLAGPSRSRKKIQTNKNKIKHSPKGNPLEVPGTEPKIRPGSCFGGGFNPLSSTPKRQDRKHYAIFESFGECGLRIAWMQRRQQAGGVSQRHAGHQISGVSAQTYAHARKHIHSHVREDARKNIYTHTCAHTPAGCLVLRSAWP